MLVRPVTAEVSILPCRTRLPFRFGMHTMTAAPLVTCRVGIEVGGGAGGGGRAARRWVGYSSDLLVPKWFAKDPGSGIADDWRDLLGAQRAAIDALLEGGGAREDTVFGHWRRVYAERVESTPRTAGDRLVRVEGVSLLERAMIDAVCRGLGVGLRAALAGGALGFAAGELDAGVLGWTADRLSGGDRGPGGGATGRRVTLRHTVGLLDAIEPGDTGAGERVGDGLPECLVEDIRAFGLTHFKIKITSDSEEQIDRLARVWGAIRREAGAGARVTLDGNEQFESVGQFVGVLERIGREDRFAGFLDALLLIEQPLARGWTFDRAANAGMERMAAFAPCIIDEADAGLWALPEAKALGYRGVSIKSCKGVFGAVLNRARCDVWNQSGVAGAGGAVFQSGEDLTTLPVLALQQDLELMATLGVEHVERNGHHYFRGLGHLPPGERRAACDAHGDLYQADDGDGRAALRIEGGRLAIGSVLDAPGFGYAGPIDLDARTPAAEWDPASLL